MIVLGVVVIVVAAAGGAYALGKHGSSSSTGGGGSGRSGSAGGSATTASPVKPLTVVSSSPATGTKDVASDSTITVAFSTPISLNSAQPTLTPAVAGTWRQIKPTTIEFDPAAPLMPSSSVAVTIPGGSTGVRATDGGGLASPVSIAFTVATGSILRLQQLLASLNFLPLSFAPSGAAPTANEMAMPQPGSFAWRWTGLPDQLTSLWAQGNEDVITKAAVMTFENQNGLGVDGLAGTAVWTALLKDVAAGKINSTPYDYVLVSKTLPENLTLYNNGNPQYANIPVNTGAPGADTTDGTYPVFEHVTSSSMTGTNPDGTTYDDPAVPWASFFLGGDALHGFVRATYGSPQSNGCVEMSVADAQTLWPLTPIGTLVTVIGPSS